MFREWSSVIEVEIKTTVFKDILSETNGVNRKHLTIVYVNITMFNMTIKKRNNCIIYRNRSRLWVMGRVCV